jgi:hypothetical protein
VPRAELERRTLKSIAEFTKEMAGRSRLDRIRKKQSDADAIKNWEKELTRAFERFSVCFVSQSNRNLPHEMSRSLPCYSSTFAKRLLRLDKTLIDRMVRIHVQCHHDRHA